MQMIPENRPHVLLVDDDKADALIIQKAFDKTKSNFQLHIANQGETALGMLHGTHGFKKLDPTPAMILLDINMPGMNGLEFLQVLRTDPLLNKIAVFMLTTSDENSDMLTAFNLNVSGYMIKPVSFDKFVESIETVCQYWEIIEKPFS